MSTRPSFLIASSASRLTSSSLELSAAIHSALMPRPARCAWAFSRSGALREEITTRAPCSPSASAICSPRPREPPVIRAFLPVRSNAFLMLPMVKSSRLWAKFYSAFPPDILFATKHGRATFHEGLDALLHVFAAEDAILDLGNVIDRSCLAGLDVFQCGFLGHLNADRRVLRDELRDFHRTTHLLAGSDDFLNKPDFVRTGRIELVAQEQMIHRISPAGPGQIAKVGASKRRDSALRLHLAEPGVIGRNDDIASQHHFDADRETDALHCRHNRLAATAFQRERIDVSGLDLGILGLWSKEFRHIEPGREIRAFGAEYPDPVIVRLVEKRHRVRHLRHHLRAEGVLLRHIVDDDLEHMPVHLGPDLPDLGFLAHNQPPTFSRQAVRRLAKSLAISASCRLFRPTSLKRPPKHGLQKFWISVIQSWRSPSKKFSNNANSTQLPGHPVSIF